MRQSEAAPCLAHLFMRWCSVNILYLTYMTDELINIYRAANTQTSTPKTEVHITVLDRLLAGLGEKYLGYISSNKKSTSLFVQ